MSTLSSSINQYFRFDDMQQIFRMKIPQWALTELFVTPMDIVDFICDKLGVN